MTQPPTKPSCNERRRAVTRAKTTWQTIYSRTRWESLSRKHKDRRKKLFGEHFWAVANYWLRNEGDWLIASIRERAGISLKFSSKSSSSDRTAALCLFFATLVLEPAQVSMETRENQLRAMQATCVWPGNVQAEPCARFPHFPKPPWDANECQMNCFPRKAGELIMQWPQQSIWALTIWEVVAWSHVYGNHIDTCDK